MATIQLGAAITRYHPAGSPLTGGRTAGNLPLLGNPGPQPRFDFSDPRYKGVVPYCVRVNPVEQ